MNTEPLTAKSRIAWIDVAKGICLVSVIAGHLGVTEINQVVFSYHLTVFFILSGYTLKPVKLDAAYLNKKFRSQMIPYFITCVCIAVMDVFNSLYQGGTSIETVTSVLSKNLMRSFMASGSITSLGSLEIGTRIGAIWFLPALFFAIVFTQLILRYIPARTSRFAVGTLLMALAVVSARFIWLPFSVQAAMTAVPFLLVGYECRQVDLLEQIDGKICLACLGVFLICWKLDKTMLTFVSAQMDDILFSPLAGICSSLVIIYCARKLEHCKPLAWIGRNSLTCLCVHLFEMETMKSWFGLILARLSIPDWELTRFCIKLLFILTVTAMLGCAKRSFRRKSFTLSKTESGRDLAVDITKGILIVLMLVGHFAVEAKCRSIIYSFHMMAFVFFSGYFFRPESCGKMRQSIGKLIRSFGIPYAVFSALYVVGGVPGKRHFSGFPLHVSCFRRPSLWGRYTLSLCCFS